MATAVADAPPAAAATPAAADTPAAAAAPRPRQQLPARAACTHTPSYCEENVFLLIRQLAERHGLPLPSLYAAFITNRARAAPVWQQRAGRGGDGLALWDYHVVALLVPQQPEQAGQQGEGTDSPAAGEQAGPPAVPALAADQAAAVAGADVEAAAEAAASAAAEGGQSTPALVLDLDTRLPFPCPLPLYASAALQQGHIALPPELRRVFRLVPARLLLRHFASDRKHMLDKEGRWLSPPPPYPPIASADGSTSALQRYLDVPDASDAVNDATQARLLLAEAEALHEAAVAAAEAAEAAPDYDSRQPPQQSKRQRHDEAAPAAVVAAGAGDLRYGICLTEGCFLELFSALQAAV